MGYTEMVEQCAKIIDPPEVWTEQERLGLINTYAYASARHGHSETLFAVAAYILKRRAAAVRALAR